MRIRKYSVIYKNLWIEQIIEAPYEIEISRHFTEMAAIKESRKKNNKLSENHEGYYYVKGGIIE